MPGHRASFRSLEPGGCSRNSGLAMHVLAIVIVFAVREPFRLPSCSTSRPLAKMIAVGCVLILAAALYVIALADFPHRVDGDAAAQANNAMEFLGASPPPIVGVGWFGRANLYYFLDSIALAMFGPTLFGMRIFGAIGGYPRGTFFLSICAISDWLPLRNPRVGSKSWRWRGQAIVHRFHTTAA